MFSLELLCQTKLFFLFGVDAKFFFFFFCLETSLSLSLSFHRRKEKKQERRKKLNPVSSSLFLSLSLFPPHSSLPPSLLETHHHPLDHVGGPEQLLLRDHQRRRQPDDVPVRRLREQALPEQPRADVVRGLPRPLRDFDGVEQALAAHELDHRGRDRGEPRAQQRPEPLRVLREALVDQDLERGHGDAGGDGVAAVGRAVLPSADRQHDLFFFFRCFFSVVVF